MSRGYDDDDYDDYYDDDDDYDYRPQIKQPAKKAAPKAPAGKTAAPAATAKAAGKTAASGTNAPAKANAATKAATPATASSKASSLPPAPPKLAQQQSSSGASVSDDEDAFSNRARSTQSSDASEASSQLPSITIVVAGHVDAGKSTLVGNLLYQLGFVSRRIIEANEREAARLGKASFHFAWVTDESSEERERGVTVNAATKYLKTTSRSVILVDGPGHRDFIPNMISACAQADAALLMVPATMGEFETAIGSNSQTREHALLLRAHGVENIIVAVNKMDMTSPAWSEERFNYIRSEVISMLEGLDFDRSRVTVLPVSGLSGTNVVQPAVSLGADNPCPWYSGPSLVNCIDTLPIIRSSFVEGKSRSFRGLVCSISEQQRGVEATVLVLRGSLKVGRNVGFLGGVTGALRVMSISAASDGCVLTELGEKEQGIVHLVDSTNQSSENMGVNVGAILFKGPPVLRPVSSFRAAIITMADLSHPLIKGSELELFVLGKEVVCSIGEVYGFKDSASGEAAAAPRLINPSRSALVRLDVQDGAAVLLETYAACPALGRFVLRGEGKTVAVGVVVDIENP